MSQAPRRPTPDHCQGYRRDGCSCREYRGLRWCAYNGLWYCRRHHAGHLQHGTRREAHRAVCTGAVEGLTRIRDAH